jgi:alanine-glyoxylate transaminase/(R)-3-amino-2-methylpropionate-pyruvate transaminase
MVVMAKGIANGMPMGACITTPEIAKVLATRVYYNTFAGNALSVTAARTTMRIIDEEKL